MIETKNNYFVNEVDKIVQIELTQGKWACIDLDDFDLVMPYRWNALRRTKDFYARAAVRADGKQKAIFMHRLVMGLDFGDKREVDHLSHMTLDNRRSQLEIKTHRGNMQNYKKKGSSPYPGVNWDKKSQKWRATIAIAGIQRYLGLFVDEIEAAAAYRTALRVHGLRDQAHRLEAEALEIAGAWST